MGSRDGRHGVIGIFQSNPPEYKTNDAITALNSYSWADTVFYHPFSSYSGIYAVDLGYAEHDFGSWVIASNGLHYPSGVTARNVAVYILGRDDLLNLTPSSSNEVKDPVADNSNRGLNTVTSSGIWEGTITQTYLARISSPGIAGVAKCDIYGPQGQTISQNNTIYNGQAIVCSGAMGIVFNDDGPFYTHDSWAIRGLHGKISMFAVDVDYSATGDGRVDSVVLGLDANNNSAPLTLKSKLESEISADLIIVNSGMFGQPIEYGVHYDSSQVGNDLYLKININKTSDSDSVLVKNIIIAVGDDEESVAW